MNILEYNGYHGTVEVDLERDVLRGKVLFISDLVTYEAADPKQLRTEFEAAIDDYLDTCAELEIDPKQPASGTFNVRVGPERHRAAQVRAVADGVSMNEVVSRALDCYLSGSREVREKHVEKHYLALDNGQESILIPLSEADFSGGVSHVLQ